jgi:hypothetical protein
MRCEKIEGTVVFVKLPDGSQGSIVLVKCSGKN